MCQKIYILYWYKIELICHWISVSFLQTEVRQICISTAGAMLFVVGENVSIVLSCLVPACCGHPVERMMRREGRYRWSRGTRRNWGSHDPGSPWSCHTQQPWSVSTPHSRQLSAPSTLQNWIWWQIQHRKYSSIVTLFCRHHQPIRGWRGLVDG